MKISAQAKIIAESILKDGGWWHSELYSGGARIIRDEVTVRFGYFVGEYSKGGTEVKLNFSERSLIRKAVRIRQKNIQLSREQNLKMLILCGQDAVKKIESDLSISA